MKILICGYGNIGYHIAQELLNLDLCYDAYDIQVYDKYNQAICDEHLFNIEYDFVFICVPTDNNNMDSCNTNEVEEVLSKVKANTIVLKSAVPIGFCEQLGIKNLVYSPEYWGTTIHSSETPNFSILGGNPEYTHTAADLYSKIKDGSYRFIFTDYKTAELAKYMENCFIALKVTFCNEFAEVAEKYGVNYHEFRECWLADKRVSPSHTFAFKDQPYYDSHCLNKDIPAFINQCNIDGISVPLMQMVEMINSYKKGKTKNEINT